MDPAELAFFVTAAAVAVSNMVPDDDQLGILSVAFTQLGDTLATIVAQRALLEKKKGQDQDNNIELDVLLRR